MSDINDHSGPPNDDLLAAEYVLGVLAQAERLAVERRVAREPAFADLVVSWEARLLPWADDIAAVAPPRDVWERIAATLPVRTVRTAEKPNGMAFWRGWAIGSSALAAASLAALLFVLSNPAPRPLTAALDGGGHRHFVATLDPQRAQMLVMPAAFAATAERVPELWLIAPGDKPRSLGLLNAERAVSIAIPANLRTQANAQAVLAVSLEPPGGSKTGAPTGPVIAQGKLTNL